MRLFDALVIFFTGAFFLRRVRLPVSGVQKGVVYSAKEGWGAQAHG